VVAEILRGLGLKELAGAAAGDVGVRVVVKEVGEEGRDDGENTVGGDVEVGESGGEGGRVRSGGILFRCRCEGDDFGAGAD
jgi:hypothetical protein